MKKDLFSKMLRFFAVIAFVLMPCSTSSAENLSWSVHIYPKNSDYVEVFISAKNAEKKTYYIDVAFDISYFSNGKLVKTENYKFTGQDIEALEPEQVYRRFYKCPVTAVTDVKGGELNYTKIYGGLKPNPRDPILMPRDKHRETSNVSSQEVYESRDAIRTVKYLPLPSGLSNEIVAGFDRAHKRMDDGDYKAAIQEYQRIISANENLAIVYLYLAQAFAKERDCKNAQTTYSKATELGRDDIFLAHDTQDWLTIYCYKYPQSPNQH